ncbi:MAG: DUF4476 domain-containing protein [Flavobacteriales bacterium]|nr:DUF4476 domain-containing protein [Flavobacteriales bacterium]
MKKIYTVVCSLLFSAAAFSQTSSATIFSENGEKFTIYLNGEQQNDTPKSNVKMTSLISEFYQLRVDFADAALKDFSDNTFGLQAGMDNSYMIKVNKKGEFVCRWQSATPLTGSAATTTQPVDSDVKNYAEADDAPVEKTEGSNSSTQVATNETGVNNSVTVTEKTTTTTKTDPNTTTTDKVSMNMNLGGVNMGVDVKVEGDAMEMGTDVQESHSTTTTTTTKTTTSNNTSNTAIAKPREEVVIVDSRCASAMSQANFDSAKNSIGSKGFDETKLSQAKTITKANCLKAAQIKEICELFGFEETKLAYAKYAYDYCFDQSNYYIVNDVFGFSSSTEELNEYINSK